MTKIFNRPNSCDDFGGKAQIQFYLDYIKAHPEECSNLLRVMKARLSFSDNDKAYIGDLCSILEGILQQTDDCCAEILDILHIIYTKYNRTPLTLLVNIAYKNSSYASLVFEMLIQWLKADIWSEGKLVNLYQLLFQLLEKEPDFCGDIFNVASYAVLRLENDTYCNNEVQKLFNRLITLKPELSEKIKKIISNIDI